MDLLKRNFDEQLYNYISQYAPSEKEMGLIKDIFEGGKRLRPIICLAIASSFKNEQKPIEKIAIAIELIHNASLIIDDLPCMDNDLYRRNQKTIHYKYGETVALLEAFKLMGIALNLIFQTVAKLDNDNTASKNRIFVFNEIIYKNLGRDGLPMGQYIDIKLLKNQFTISNKKQHKDLIFKKTTTLFNLSFLLSFALYTSDRNKLTIMEKASKWFGLAFQIYDDFTDISQDCDKNSPNIVNKFGKETAFELFNKAVKKTKKYLNELEINLEYFNQILDKLSSNIHL